MRTFEVTLKFRQWVDYVHIVEAEDEETAIEIAASGEGLQEVIPIHDNCKDDEGEPEVIEVNG